MSKYAENVFFGREIENGIFLNKAEMQRRTAELAKEMGIEVDPKARIKDLGVAYSQITEILKAISHDTKILIMDEATAAMDTETERRIQYALGLLTKGRTTIMIAHRLSTLRDADKLIVIENGKMPEFGTHTELLKQKGVYFKLYKLQMEALKNIGIEAD